MVRITEKSSESICEKKRLSKTELQFMQVIWEHPEGIASEKIYKMFPQARGTKSTVLANIAKKGYIENFQEGLHHIYKPLMSRLEYERTLALKELEETFGENPVESFVAAFCWKEELTEQEKTKIWNLLEEIEEET
mgnify:CR=1 FL=1